MTSDPALGCVVIPAHNEEAVLARCLEPLSELVARRALTVVVTCNGCSDQTATIARGFPGVDVVELTTASKPAALRAGEETIPVEGRHLPRLYLDADVVVPTEAVVAVLTRLAADRGPLAARPPLVYETTDCSALVRRYYRARAAIPAVMNSLWGAGVYGLSRDGRARFDEFPEVVADDLWADQQFAVSEIEILGCSPVVVSVPLRTADLVRVLSRVYRGKAEHRQDNPETARDTAGDTLRDLRRLAGRCPGGTVDAAVYLLMALAGRVAGAARRARGRRDWERDLSARNHGRGPE